MLQPPHPFPAGDHDASAGAELELELQTSPADRDPGGIAATITAMAGMVATLATAQGAPWWVPLAATVVATGAQLWARLRAWAPATVERHALEVAQEARVVFADELEVLDAALEEARKAHRRDRDRRRRTDQLRAEGT